MIDAGKYHHRFRRVPESWDEKTKNCLVTKRNINMQLSIQSRIVKSGARQGPVSLHSSCYKNTLLSMEPHKLVASVCLSADTWPFYIAFPGDLLRTLLSMGSDTISKTITLFLAFHSSFTSDFNKA